MEMMTNKQIHPIQKSAVDLLNEGFSVLPVNGYDHPNKPKAPTVPSWKQYQTTRMDVNSVVGFFKNGCSIAVIGGHVSGNLECLDFDNPPLFKPFMNILEEINPGLAVKLVQRATPSGGYHLIYRCESIIDGNLKLAESKDGQTWIETRGEGGYFLTTPSPGYTAIRNNLKDIPVITGKERELLLNLARSLSGQPERPNVNGSNHITDGTRPGDAFNKRHVHDIADMLERNGWINTERISAGGLHWTRPGKQEGTSATLKNGCLYVFSTNTDIPPGPHDAFGIYTYLMHGGDFTSAGKHLAAKGYGEVFTVALSSKLFPCCKKVAAIHQVGINAKRIMRTWWNIGVGAEDIQAAIFQGGAGTFLFSRTCPVQATCAYTLSVNPTVAFQHVSNIMSMSLVEGIARSCALVCLS